jgi:hypothetical protein
LKVKTIKNGEKEDGQNQLPSKPFIKKYKASSRGNSATSNGNSTKNSPKP